MSLKSNRQKRKLTKSGFTLPELLITCVLISIISLVIAGFLTAWLDSYANTRARTLLLEKAQIALDGVTQDIRLSGAADLHNRWPDANAPGSDNYSWTSDADTLILAEAATDNSRNIIFADPNKYISVKDNVIYYLSGQDLYRRVLASDNSSDSATTTCPPTATTSTCPADDLIADGVDSFSVKYYDSDENQVAPDAARSVDLVITLEDASPTKTVKVSYHTRMVFRNE